MQSKAQNPEAYLAELPPERKPIVQKIRTQVLEHLPPGFEERMSYGMLGYVVPHQQYPPGYHCDPKLPLPFINLASQKHYVALYHMGIYANPNLMEWFQEEYPKHCKYKLDMGKSCIRFKKMEDIPYDLIGTLCSKMSVGDWITLYEKQIKR